MADSAQFRPKSATAVLSAAAVAVSIGRKGAAGMSFPRPKGTGVSAHVNRGGISTTPADCGAAVATIAPPSSTTINRQARRLKVFSDGNGGALADASGRAFLAIF